MAAPAASLRISFIFRDAKGQIGRMRVLIGGATNAAVLTSAGTLTTDLQAATNAHVSTNVDSAASHVYGTNAEFPNVEDKAQLVFADTTGNLHRYQLPAPLLACFATDGETVVNSGVMATVIGDFQSFVYGHNSDVGPLAYIGGIRQRRRMQRRFNIFTKDPTLASEGE